MSTQDRQEAAELHAHQAEQDRLKNPVPDDNAVAAVEELFSSIIQNLISRLKSQELSIDRDWSMINRDQYLISRLRKELIKIAQDTGTVYAYRKRAAEIRAES